MRVLVCRPLAESEATAAKLVAAGHEPVLGPLLRIEARPVVLPAGSVDAVVATSRHAFAGLAAADAGRLRRCPVLAVGESTARVARALGFADVRVGQGDAAGLADLVRLTLPPGARLVYLAGETRKDTLSEVLAGGDYAVTIRESYAARSCEAWPPAVAERLRAGDLDACLHFSRRSAALAVAASEAGGALSAFLGLHHLCLSGDAAAPLHERHAAVTVADRPTEDSLMQALSRTLS